MADLILVVAEQRDGKLNRVSFETIAAAQAIAKDTGWAVEVVLPGSGVAALAQEFAAKAAREGRVEASAQSGNPAAGANQAGRQGVQRPGAGREASKGWHPEARAVVQNYELPIARRP